MNIEKEREAFEKFWVTSETISAAMFADSVAPRGSNKWYAACVFFDVKQICAESKPLTVEQYEHVIDLLKPTTTDTVLISKVATDIIMYLRQVTALPSQDEKDRRIAELEADVEKFKQANRYQRGYHDGQREGMVTIGERSEEILKLKDIVIILESKIAELTTDRDKWMEANGANTVSLHHCYAEIDQLKAANKAMREFIAEVGDYNGDSFKLHVCKQIIAEHGNMARSIIAQYQEEK